MNIPKEVVAVLAIILTSGLLFSALAVVDTSRVETAFGPEAAVTPYSIDHARAQAGARDEERAPTF